MGSFSRLGVKLRERKRTVAAVVAFTVIGVANFFAGTWSGSSGAFTLGPTTASQQHAADAPKPGGMCCDMSMPMDKMHMDKMPMPSGMPKPSGMPMPSHTP
jgi:hypothetical protein